MTFLEYIKQNYKIAENSKEFQFYLNYLNERADRFYQTGDIPSNNNFVITGDFGYNITAFKISLIPSIENVFVYDIKVSVLKEIKL